MPTDGEDAEPVRKLKLVSSANIAFVVDRRDTFPGVVGDPENSREIGESCCGGTLSSP